MESRYFGHMLDLLAKRAASSTTSWLGFSNVPLRRHLQDVFSRGYGQEGSFIGDPAFEAVFGWTQADKVIGELAGTLLSSELITAMDAPANDVASEYRFPRDRRPYAHQVEAWRTLAAAEPRSVLVASGTGSGKTECFMVPILDRLVRERKSVGGRLIGVRALFLYPLNALINSQRDRLSAWTSGFESDIRFALYNGLTPEVVKTREQSSQPSEVLDRKSLRATPPPILVTNATMLEYMLVRTQDSPILQQSQGKLEWVVLDEAHTYIGSQAAEMALLIRRVLHSFGVTPERVRFVATSATIGRSKEEGADQLRSFLAQLAGVDAARVHVVTASRAIPKLPSPSRAIAPSRDELWRLAPSNNGGTPARYAALTEHPTARSIRDLFVSTTSSTARLSDVCGCLFGSRAGYAPSEQAEALDWLDLLASSTDGDATPFLPLRAHIFHQTLSGVWACADPRCSGKAGTALGDARWPFGQLHFVPRQHCSCGSPVYEVVACEECGVVYLRADERDGMVIHEREAAVVDEFELEVEHDREEDDAEGMAVSEPLGPDHGILIVNRSLPNCGELGIRRSDRRIVELGSPDALHIIACEEGDEGLQCPACTASSRHDNGFRKARVGAPFLLGGILPTLLEFAPDGKRPKDQPYRGHRLLTFSDSRQGTARLAARLQQDAERTAMRGLIYHHVLPRAGGSNEDRRRTLTNDLKQLEVIRDGLDTPEKRSPILRLIAERRRELDQLSQPVTVPFSALERSLAQEGLDFDFILRAYQKYAREMFGGSEGARSLAGMLLVREFGRRPRRQNNLETMGLVAVRYPKLEQVASCPPEWQGRSLSLDDWRNFLKVAVDLTVRGGGSLDVPLEWRNWLGVRFSRKVLVPANEQDVGRGQRRWPQARRGGASSPLVRLLAYLFQVDIRSPYGMDIVDQLLVFAWEDLRRIGLLSIRASGYFLRLEDLAFQSMQRAWVCPVTRRFLDTSVRGVTPYLPRQAEDANALCEQRTLPVYDLAFGGEVDPVARIQRAREWIANQPEVKRLREEGLWSDFNDRVIELSPYFAAAEHSAQQPAEVLEKYEKAFKDGMLNLLSCSTTMEMGIDIGGVQIVAMNNVPPNPANYLQRAGRAGRRQETRAAAVTLCKSNPHDQAAFDNSRWPFETALPAPSISLDSAVLVQRHVNAMVLSQFLADVLVESGKDISKLSSGWFFQGDDRITPAHRFIGFCSAYRAGVQPGLEQGLRLLTRHSVFEGHDVTVLLNAVANESVVIVDDWMNEWDALIAQESGATSADGTILPLRQSPTRSGGLPTSISFENLLRAGFCPPMASLHSSRHSTT